MESLTDYAEEVKNLFRSIHKNFRMYVAAQVGEQNFTVPQIMVLQELYQHPAITLKELSEEVGLARSTVCGIVDRLARQGAVNRVRDLNDRRTVRISLSPQVSELNETINLIKKNYLASLLKDLEPKDWEQIVCALRMLNNLTENHPKG